MKILLVSELNFSNVSGYLRALDILTRDLLESGHQVAVLTPTGGNRKNTPPVKVIEIPSLPLPFYRELRMSLPGTGIKKVIEKIAPDLIHLFQPTCLGVYVGLSGRRMGIPMISSFHGNIVQYCDYYHLSWLRNGFLSFTRWAHGLGDIILAPSPGTVSKLLSYGFKNVKLWGRGVNQTLFSPSFRNREFLSRYGINPQKSVALFVGRIAKEKNPDMLTAFLRQVPSAQLLVVGEGPYRKKLEKIFSPFNAYFTGYIHGKELSTVYASSDIFLFPSKTETFGQVVLEAMASGLPVAAFNAEGVRDIVIHNKTGYLAENDSDWLSYANELILNKELREELGKAGVNVSLNWTWEKSLTQVKAAYKELIETESSDFGR
jgi:phosphatidylinositol alpha 1,6-mannosyltransferase